MLEGKVLLMLASPTGDGNAVAESLGDADKEGVEFSFDVFAWLGTAMDVATDFGGGEFVDAIAHLSRVLRQFELC